MVCFPKWEDSAFNCASRHLEVNAALPSARGFSRERLGPIKLPPAMIFGPDLDFLPCGIGV